MTLSSRPGFQVLIYPGPLGIPDVIPADAPPAFLLVANDDRGASRVVASPCRAWVQSAMIGKFSGPRRTVDFPGERGPMRVRYRQQNRLPRNLALTREQEDRGESDPQCPNVLISRRS
jgi:hypothetical protein